MALPTVSIDNREIILLSGFETIAAEASSNRPFVLIFDQHQLELSVRNDNKDTIAYGYVAGKWVAAA